MNGKAIKAKITSVKKIQKITKTMEMVSVSKMRKSTARALQTKGYVQKVEELLQVLGGVKNTESIFVKGKPKSSTTLLIILASNKGLCGAYNAHLNKKARELVSEKKGDIEAVVIGKYAEAIARRNNISITESYTDFSNEIDEKDIASLVHSIFERFTNDPLISDVKIIHTQFVKILSYVAKTTQLLPLAIDSELTETQDKKKGGSAGYELEPSASHILKSIVPGLLQGNIHHMANEAAASEHSSRMVAMKNASDNAGRMSDELKLSYNRARQAAITQEISEIINASEALA